MTPLIFIVFSALRWADEKCRENGIDYSAENRRQMLGPALFKIRFPLFSHNEFTVQIVSSGILIVEEVAGIKQYHSQSKLCGISEGLLYGPLQFPSHWRHLTFGTIVMDIEKVSEFAREKELMYTGNGFYNREGDKVTLTVDFILKNAEMGQFSAPKTSDKTIFMEIEKVFEFFCEIIGSERKSETVHIKGLPWKIIAKINADNEDIEKTLGFYLFCAVPKETPNWSRKCSATFRIVSGNSRRWFEGRMVSNETPIHGFDNFVRFSYLQSDIGGYDMEEDKVTLAIDIYVDDEKRERPDNSIFG
ncbi:hypothetical protein niasHT_016933 [Heterodera trifolii]|uniref:MATH domain-containing protein n=1 Tax=Heterodera trifolii TaxID=157864 RepID=A0ABD2L351_9BILA